MPKARCQLGFGAGLTGTKTSWWSQSHFDSLNTNHGCGWRFGVKGFGPHPPQAQTFHPAVCTMRAAKSSATLETCDCSVLNIRRKAATGNTAAAALRDSERWKEQSQSTQGTQGTPSSSLTHSLLFEAHPEEPFRSIQFWHVILTSSLVCTVVVGRFLTS